MTRTSRTVAAALLCCLGGMTTLAGEGSSRYREFELGANVASVSALAGLSQSMATTSHARPALLQELAWRRPYSSKGPVDPVQTIVFSFYNDQLFKLVIDYDRERTAGMSSADLIEALSTIYGDRLLVARKTEGATQMPTDEFGAPLAVWSQPGQAVALHVSSYQPSFRLVVTSPSLDALARTAGAEARLEDQKEAPQRELDRQQQNAETVREAQEKARTSNKAAFRP